RQWVAETSKPVIIYLLPIHHYVEGIASPRAYQARFKALADPPRVIVLDPLPDYAGLLPEERRRLRFEHDTHPTPAAHRLLAQSLARPIESLLQASRQGEARCQA